MYKSESLECDLDLQDYGDFSFINSQEIEVLQNLPLLDSGLLANQDETLDVAYQRLPSLDFQMVPSRGPPMRDTKPGKLNFIVEVDSKDTNRKYVYSHQLNRLYVAMDKDFPIQFNWNHKGNEDMYVRAMVVFSDDSQAQKRVERCVQHEHSSANIGLSPHIYKNVLHSAREIGTQGVEYFGDPNFMDSWYSVRVQIRKTTNQPVSHAYKFVCKNSCSTGINRRSIAIIFTLEDQFGHVMGRQLVGARACACPTRDILRDEKAEVPPSGKRLMVTPKNDSKTTKKIKLEVVTEKVVTLPPLRVVGEKAMIAGLEVMQRMMEQGTDHTKHDPETSETYAKCLEEFKKALADLKKPKT